MASRFFLLTMLVTGWTLPGSSQAAAADAADASGPDQAERVYIEEIVVYGARRRETLLQETGASIQAIDGTVFTAMGAESTDDISLYSPGVNIQAGQIGFMSIRGVKGNSFSAGTEGASSMYVDGVYFPRTVSVLEDIADIERVEVLRGPQGTQFGRNAMGGAVNMITAKPTEEFQIGALGRVGDYDERRMEAFVSGPVVEDSVLFRLHGLRGLRDGHVENIAEDTLAPDKLDDQDLKSVRGHLEFRPNDRGNLLISADWLETDETGPAQPIVSGGDDLLANGATIPYGDIRKTAIYFDNFQVVEDRGLSATFAYDLTDYWEVKALLSQRKLDHEFFIDGDLTDLESTSVSYDETSEPFQGELQLTYQGQDVIGTFGLFYFKEENTLDFAVEVPFVRSTEPPGLRIEQFEDNETNAFAAFTDWAWDFRDDMTLNVGLRWSWEEKDHVTGVSVNLINPPINLSDTGPLEDSDSWTAFTPRIGLDYRPKDDRLYYALISRGFKAGGFNLGDPTPFDPEYLWNYEVGHKASFFNNTLQANLSLFWMELRDQQVEIVERDEFFVTSPRTTNAGETRIRGVEFDLFAQPTEWLSFNTGIAYLDAEFLEFPAAVEVLGEYVEFDLSGNRPTQTPEWHLSSGIQFDFSPRQIGIELGGEVMVRIEHQYVDETYGQGNGIGELNRPNDKLPSYSIFNARLAYRFPDERFEVSLLGRNLTDELRVIRLGNLEQEYYPPETAPISWMPAKPRLVALQFSFNY